jgi:hypothetical protein
MFTRRMVDSILPAKVWPIVLLAVCVVGELMVLNVGIDDLDEGYFAQQALRLLHGQVPYRDFETLYTPGLGALHAGVFAALGGSASLMAMRALALAARAALAVLLYVLARPIVRNPLWAAMPSVVLLLGVDDAPVRWEPHPGWLSSLFAVTCVWCGTRRCSTGWLLAAGVAAAAAYAVKQNTGVFILAALLVWSGRRFWIPLAAFVGVTIVWLLPLATAVLSAAPLASLGVLVGAVSQAGLFSPPEPTLLIPAACLAGGIWLVRRDPDPRLRWYLLGGTAIFLTEFPRMDTLHLLWSAPVLLVLGAAALDRMRPLVAVVVLLVVVGLLAPNWTSRVEYLRQPMAPVPSGGVVAPVSTADDINATVAEIQQRTHPNEPIFVYPTSPLLYALAVRPNPTRFDHLNPGSASSGQLAQVIADLSRANVRLAVVSDFWEAAWGPPGESLVLEDWLNAHFTEVARHGAYRVLAADL